MPNRRDFSAAAAMTLLGGTFLPALPVFAQSSRFKARNALANKWLQALEVMAQGRLGVHIIDTATSHEFGFRQNERFMMLSSFKWMACAVVLARVDAGVEALERRIVYSPQDLVDYSPITSKYANGEGMTLAQLCDATITTSDNTAANLILASYGGPAALTALARKVGDSVTRLDRIEPALNVKLHEVLLDTTSPRAMAQTMQKVVLGDVLSASSRAVLQRWLLANTTGGKRLKAGLPAAWQTGDKTGTNQTDSNDIAVIWPPDRKPWLVTAYVADSPARSDVRDATLAQVGGLVQELATL